MRRTVVAAVVAMLAGLLGPAALAKDDAKKQARMHFKVAERLYRLGEFADALASYSKAYEAKPLAGFLFNIGQCHRELGNFEKAVKFYENYLRDKPRAKNKKIVLQLIGECKQKQAEKEEQERKQEEERKIREAEERRLAEEAERREQERVRLEQERLANERMKEALAAEEKRKAEEEGKVWKQWWFWTAIGGAVAIAGGVTAGVLANREETRTVLPSGSLGTLDRRGE